MTINNSGVLSAMSAMVNLEIPWINIMSKMDLVSSSADNEGGARIGLRKRKDIARCASLTVAFYAALWTTNGLDIIERV